MQTTFNNRIANADGGFWEPFAWNEEEMAYLNQFFGTVDTWALSRKMYEAIGPWWDTVARGEVPDDAPAVTATDRVVISGDIAGELAALKRRAGRTILLSCGRPPSPRSPARPA
jgi:dihydrofolate reductase